jgi:hypothetical protein
VEIDKSQVEQPEWAGEITEGQLTEIVNDLRIPTAPYVKAMARKLREYMQLGDLTSKTSAFSKGLHNHGD